MMFKALPVCVHVFEILHTSSYISLSPYRVSSLFLVELQKFLECKEY